LVVERDDGLWSIGFDDNAAGPFQSHRHAEAVVAASIAERRRAGESSHLRLGMRT
jgi:hypothetical protein